MTRGTAILAVLLVLATAAAGREVRGRVFLDQNANGRHDAGEPPLAGVPVSDGVGFVRTDAGGAYVIDARLHELLPPTKQPIVTVSFPSGTWPMAGWFRRIDAATNANRVDFPLRRDEQRLPLVFVHATDPHVPRAGRQRFDDFRKEMGRLAPRVPFCILTGDCVDLADVHPPEKAKAEWDLFAEQTRDFPLPLFCIPGNHDAAGVNCLAGWDRDDPTYGYGFYWKVVGPLRWSFNYAGVHFVGIDYMRKAGPAWVWGVPPSAVQWLAEDLRLAPRPGRVLLFVHYTEPDGGLADLLKRHQVTHVFCGHTHQVAEGRVAGVPRTLSGSVSRLLPGSQGEPGYRIVRVEEDGLETFYKPVGAEIAVGIDHPSAGGWLGKEGVVRGRFFDPDGRVRSVAVRVDGAKADAEVHRGPIFSLFEARLDPAKARPGFRELTVAATDGRESWTRRRRCLIGLRIAPSSAPAR